MKILVVDDETMILELTRRILERAGFEVHTAESGADAVRLIESSQDGFAGAIIDYSLGDLSGTQVMASLRQAFPDVPIVISSGHTLHPNDLPLQLQRNVTFLQKPYRASVLVEHVQKVLITDQANR